MIYAAADILSASSRRRGRSALHPSPPPPRALRERALALKVLPGEPSILSDVTAAEEEEEEGEEGGILSARKRFQRRAAPARAINGSIPSRYRAIRSALLIS